MSDNAASGDPPADGGQPDAPASSPPPPPVGSPPADTASAPPPASADDEAVPADGETAQGGSVGAEVAPDGGGDDDLHTQQLADAVRAVAEQHAQADAAAESSGSGGAGAAADAEADAAALADDGADAAADAAALPDDGADGADDAAAFPHFDEDTLANIAALSRIGAEDDPDGAAGELDLNLLQLEQQFTSQQVQDFVRQLQSRREGREDGGEGGGDGTGEAAGTAEGDGDGEDEDGAEDRDTVDGTEAATEGGDDEFPAPRGAEDAPKKRRRQRTVLNCDRNVPCNRCIKRGLPGMCRMEAPFQSARKKRRRIAADVPIDYELSLRVQALESLIRSGSSMDADAASSAAMETIMHATRAANSGQQEAVNALAQLTSASSGLGIGGMTQDAQSSLLLDVLQQLSAASMGRPADDDSPTHVEMRETWSSVPAAAAPDRTVAADMAYNEDPSPIKLNAAIAGFLDEHGKIFVPPTVRYADKMLRADSMLLDATPIEGHAGFLDVGTRFAYGEDSAAYKNKRIAAIQTVSLTGALRLAATFVARFPPALTRSVYVPEPTSEEDQTALRDAGLDIKYYRYLDAKTGAVDWAGLKEDLTAAPPRSAVLLYVSGSLPTGVELSAPQWRLMTAILQERQLIPLVAMAFQGLTSGDTNRDAQPIRFMVHESVPVVLAQSFEAMTGLYVDCPAIVSVPTRSTADRERVDSQLRAIARSWYARPSPWGARIVHSLLSDAKLYPAWLNEIKAMSDRLRSVKDKLYDRIVNKLKTPGSWMHIKRAGGMYCTTLLPAAQVEALATRRHVHLLADGSVSLACLDAPKIDQLARAIDAVVRDALREAEEQAAQMAAMAAALEAARIQQAREDAEAAAAAQAAADEAAREEDAAQLEASIRSAMEAQRREEEEERRRDEETSLLEEQVRKAAERAEIERRAEQIIATI